MKKLIGAFDIDGTLRCNCTPTCQDINQRVLEGLYFFRNLKNVRVMMWSGGGVAYVEQFLRAHDIGTRGLCIASKLDPNTWKWGRPDFAVDDQQGFNMADMVFIVREK